MGDPGESITDLLVRLRPALEQIFSSNGLSAAESEEVLHESAFTLVSKWPGLRRPDLWLLRRVADRCRVLQAGREAPRGRDR